MLKLCQFLTELTLKDLCSLRGGLVVIRAWEEEDYISVKSAPDWLSPDHLIAWLFIYKNVIF